MQSVTRPTVRALTGSVYFQTPVFDNQLVRTMGHCRYGGPDFGECLATSFRIEDGNWESWYAEWLAMAQRLEQDARLSQKGGHLFSAREAWLRATECYRTAGFALLATLSDPRCQTIADHLTACFSAVLPLLGWQAERIQVPYQDTTLPATYFRVDGSDRLRPTLIITQGYHGFMEEVYYWGAAAALERGYNCLAYDGPGQGHALHGQRLHLRADWENVFTPLLDRVLQLPGVDRSRVAIMGRSTGAYLTARAACADPRVAACILDPGEMDLFDMAVASFPPAVIEALAAGDQAPCQQLLAQLYENPDRRFYFESRRQAHGVDTALDYILGLRDFSLHGRIQHIACPTLVSCADHDDRGTAQARQVYEALTCPKAYVECRAADGAGDHCESGAPSIIYRHVFDWLDGVVHP